MATCYAISLENPTPSVNSVLVELEGSIVQNPTNCLCYEPSLPISNAKLGGNWVPASSDGVCNPGSYTVTNELCAY